MQEKLEKKVDILLLIAVWSLCYTIIWPDGIGLRFTKAIIFKKFLNALNSTISFTLLQGCLSGNSSKPTKPILDIATPYGITDLFQKVAKGTVYRLDSKI